MKTFLFGFLNSQEAVSKKKNVLVMNAFNDTKCFYAGKFALFTRRLHNIVTTKTLLQAAFVYLQ